MQQISVSALLRYLKNRLDSDDNLQKIYVQGEISNFHRHFSGHLYFTLKDEKAAISCVMFKSSAVSLRFDPKNGDKVIVYANTSIFEASGQLQLYVQKMTLDGLGDLYARYEALKIKLAEEGKFAQEHKKEMPFIYPDRIAVLVGDKSAAMSDIITCFQRRWPLCKTDFYPVLVQGELAPASIIKQLKKVDDLGYQAIILARGGGSFEDLFCFNDEDLVNTIYDLKTFIISGVGHEQDFTLTDFVADLRAPTPTAAVELLTPDIEDVNLEVEAYEDRLHELMKRKLSDRMMMLDYLNQKLLNYGNHFKVMANEIDNTLLKIRNDLIHKIELTRNDIDHSMYDLKVKLDFRLTDSRSKHERLDTLLKAYNVENVLNRGYVLVSQNDKLVKYKKQLKDEKFTIRFADGNIDAQEVK
ncbi:MAG: exodeoxyribonuclease VII large subunit [Erysipelotrichaceae bacterium]|nr:exodeoxyribonuclease VII large subunit [Erysipelotrichaceae bacterium]